MPAARLADVVSQLAVLRQLVDAQERRIATLEAERSTGRKVRDGAQAGNAERSRAAAERARRLGPMAEALGWRDGGRRLSDCGLLDLIRRASPDREGDTPSRATTRRAVEAALGPARSGAAWDSAGREGARQARIEILRGHVDFVSNGASEISRRA